jgi:glycosyltransferase involved in cell wall biosynthesis
LRRDTNLGIHRNFADALYACRGQYIALLEGDDYWTSEHKLQKQVDVLDAQPEYAACFHAVLLLDEGGSREPQLVAHNQAVLTIEDLLQHNTIQTCSVVFRHGLFGEFPPWFFSRLRIVADWVLHALNAQYGDFYYLDEAMGVYRVHHRGVWTGINSIARFYERISVLTCLNEELQFRYAHILNPTISRQYTYLMNLYAQREENKQALLAGLTAARWWSDNPSISKLQLATLLLRQTMPSKIIRPMRALRRRLRR